MKKQLYLCIGLLAAIMLIIPVIMACGAQAPTVSTQAPAPAAAPVVTPAPAAQGTPQESIKLHGHWVIDVKNLDGTLASHNEFENALANTDVVPYWLASFLGGFATPGNITVGLTGANGPCAVGASPQSCGIYETTSGFTPTSAMFKTLTLSVPSSGADSGKLVLSGSANVANTGDISEVGTGLYICQGTSTAPADCTEPGFVISLTRTTLATPVAVAAGQQVLVKVVISFS